MTDNFRLIGGRIVRTSEPEEGERFDEALIKELTAGEPNEVRLLHSEFIGEAHSSPPDCLRSQEAGEPCAVLPKVKARIARFVDLILSMRRRGGDQ